LQKELDKSSGRKRSSDGWHETKQLIFFYIFSFKYTSWHTAECLQVKYEQMIAGYNRIEFSRKAATQGATSCRTGNSEWRTCLRSLRGGRWDQTSDLLHQRHRSPPMSHHASQYVVWKLLVIVKGSYIITQTAKTLRVNTTSGQIWVLCGPNEWVVRKPTNNLTVL